MKKIKIPYESKVPVKMTCHDRDLIRDETLYDPDFGQHAIVDGAGIKIELSLDEIEDIQGYVAAEANHTKDKRLQCDLDRLFEKLQKYLDKYDDQEE